MTPRWVLLAAMTALGVAAVSAQPFDLLRAAPSEVEGQQTTFRSGVDGVTMQVSVLRGNRPVGGLTDQDFELLDNGVHQTVATFASQRFPIDMTLLLDLSGSVEGRLLQRLKAAVSDTAHALEPSDRLRLIAVSQVLHEVFGFRAGNEALPLDDLTAQGATSLYDALAAAMMRSTEPARRQLIVAYTDGHDSASILDETAVRDIARLSDATADLVVAVPMIDDKDGAGHRLSQRPGTIDGILSGPVTTTRAATTRDDAQLLKVLGDLVGPTGGQIVALTPGDSVSRTFGAALERFRAGYVLQYVPTGVASVGWHDVSISVKRPGRFDIQARKGYQGKESR
jgi:VWFA-related protein